MAAPTPLMTYGIETGELPEEQENLIWLSKTLR